MDHDIVKSLGRAVLLLAICSASPALAQEQEEPSRPGNMQEPGEDQPPIDQAAPEMREMANSMKSMAEMCQTMMQREMQDRPIKMTAIVALGTVLTVALVLEIQWIRFWSLRIMSERTNLGR